MRSLKRTIPFLLLNVLISAATTLAVLTWWGGGLRNLPAAQAPSSTQVADLKPTAPPSPTLPPAETPSANSGRLIQITQVQGPGDLNNEMIQLSRLGEGDLRLTGWTIQDNAGNHFTFPDFVLSKGGAVQVYTRTGQNTAIALYWGLGEAVWAPGKTVALYDDQGAVQATFEVK